MSWIGEANLRTPEGGGKGEEGKECGRALPSLRSPKMRPVVRARSNCEEEAENSMPVFRGVEIVALVGSNQGGGSENQKRGKRAPCPPTGSSNQPRLLAFERLPTQNREKWIRLLTPKGFRGAATKWVYKGQLADAAVSGCVLRGEDLPEDEPPPLDPHD